LRGGRDFYQVKGFFAGNLKRIVGSHDAKLIAFIVDHANFTNTNAIIRADKTFVDTVLRSNCSTTKSIAWGDRTAAFGLNNANRLNRWFVSGHGLVVPIAISFYGVIPSEVEGDLLSLHIVTSQANSRSLRAD
jgi:hypothetical protein